MPMSGDYPSLSETESGQEPREHHGLDRLLVAMARNKASDLHLRANMKPIMRVSTALHEVGNRSLAPTEVAQLIGGILTPRQKQDLEEDLDLDFAYTVDGVGRFRVNVFHDRGTLATAIRRVNTEIPGFEEIHLPPIVRKIAEILHGMVIVSGPTGCGKSTTLATMINHVNENRRCHIITIEDPIEYLFQDRKSFINQREVGIDVHDFHTALKHIVRQNPDVILVGEMRDRESLDAALMAAETGHLVFGTVHASNAPQTITRILDLYPAERQDIIRQNLSFNLRAVLCQRLLPASKEGVRVVPAIEVMIVNPIVQKLIQNKEDKKIMDVIRGSAEEGMQDFNASLIKLVRAGLISKKAALENSPNPEQLRMNLQGIFLEDEHRIIG